MRSLANTTRRAALAFVVLAAPASAQVVPDLIAYQGTLERDGGPVTGTVPLVISLWDDPVGGKQLYLEDEGAVTVETGVFAVTLGDAPDAASPYPSVARAVQVGNGSVYLQVEADGTTLGPRTRFLAVPYALATPGIAVEPDGSVSAWSTFSADGDVRAAGDVVAGGGSDFAYDGPRTYHETIPAAAFRADRPNERQIGKDWYYFGGGLRFITNGSSDPLRRLTFSAPLDLPDGATIQNVKLLGYDNDAGSNVELKLHLIAQEVGQTTRSFVVNSLTLLTSGASADVQTVSAAPSTAGGLHVVDNATHAYWVDLHFSLRDDDSDDLRFYGAQIEYTLDALRP